MLSKSSNTRSFQEVLADLRTSRIGTGLPSPAEILHGRNLTTRAQAEINIKARGVGGSQISKNPIRFELIKIF